ncbi:MAG: hypothetical protein JSW62_02020, partial [Thermoplasmatales archaeon]
TTFKFLKLVERNPLGNEKIYVLTDPYLIYDLLITYKNSLLDDEVTALLLYCYDFLILNWIPRKIMKDPRLNLDLMIEALYDIFPHPYHN